jgi:ABC-type lipoprotein release transport system permease subunit
VAALAAAVAVGQAVGRHVASARPDVEILRGLGITRSGQTYGLVLLAVPAAVGGAVLAAATAWLVSPIMPIGLAREAEPDTGFSADWTVLGFGVIAVAVVVVLAATLAAIWQTRPRVAARARPEPSAVSAALARAGAGPVAANGARLALDRRAPALPVRSAIAGVAVAILGCVAVLTFSASLDRLLATPDRWGYDWDLLLNFRSAEVDAAAERIVGDDRLAAVARWDAGYSFVDDVGLRAYGLNPLQGDIGFSLRSGRQPVSPGEIVLGPDIAERLGVGLGDPVAVAPEPGSDDAATVVVVGTALFPDDADGSFAEAVGFFGEAFAEHAIAPDLFEASQLVVRLAPGLDVDDVAAALDLEYTGSVSGESLPARPGEVANLAGVRSLPLWLAAFVAVLGIASLGHVLLTTLWRRKRELATLRSVGLTPRQTLGCIMWQSATITVVGLVIGVPLGLVVGDAAWAAIADPIGVATDIDRPMLVYAATACVALAVAAVVALLPGWRAARLPLAGALRVE